MGDSFNLLRSRAADVYYGVTGHGANAIDDAVALVGAVTAHSASTFEAARRRILDEVLRMQHAVGSVFGEDDRDSRGRHLASNEDGLRP